MKEILNLVNQMSPYILLGFLLAGLMHSFVPKTLYRHYLGGSSFKSVINAALLGIPLPLCSCGVIPTAMSLRKEGASKGATISFLISTPQTGVDSIIATYSLMGLPFALLRPVIAFATALFGGFLTNRFTNSEDIDASVQKKKEEDYMSGYSSENMGNCGIKAGK
ncbi:MAG: permease, partial [Bacteroidales bacterium]|nr:permease [Bacteroidales bacterium]